MPKIVPESGAAIIVSIDPARVDQPFKADRRVHDDRWHEIQRFDAKRDLKEYPFHCIVLRTTSSKTMMRHARVGTELRIGDIVVTSADCVATIRFTIGARAVVPPARTVAVTGERTLGSEGLTIGRSLRKSSALWWKRDPEQLKEPIEIQSDGAVMGIKG